MPDNRTQQNAIFDGLTSQEAEKRLSDEGANELSQKKHRTWQRIILDVIRDVLVPEQAKAPNHVWTLDFVQDRLSKGIGIRLLTVLDEFTRESLCIRVERRLRSEDVRLTLELLFKDYGIPMYLRSDNGSEFIACCLHPRASISVRTEVLRFWTRLARDPRHLTFVY